MPNYVVTFGDYKSCVVMSTTCNKLLQHLFDQGEVRVFTRDQFLSPHLTISPLYVNTLHTYISIVSKSKISCLNVIPIAWDLPVNYVPMSIIGSKLLLIVCEFL